VQRNLRRNPLQRAGFFGAFITSIPRARLSLALLAAFVAAFLLIPAAQAAANGTMTVHLEGSGSGEVSSVGGFLKQGGFEGNPPIECSGPPESGTCETELESDGEGSEAISLHWSADPGSEVALLEVNEGIDYEGRCEGLLNNSSCIIVQPAGAGNADVTVHIESTGEVPLFLTKSGTGTGTVTSSPGRVEINCQELCSEQYGEFAPDSEVTLNPEAAFDSKFVEWTGACSGSGECKVTMDETKSVEAVFDLLPKHTLTVIPSGTGSGIVTSSPSTLLTCGDICSAEFPEGREISLNAFPETGSQFTEWTGACTGSGECKVTMSEAKSVGVVFDLDSGEPEFPLTVTKSGTGTGKVTSSPTGIDCGATCSAEFAEGTEVTLTPAADSGSEFTEWTGACTGSGECKVTISEAKSVDAVFDLIPTPKHALTVTKSGTGTGKVTSSPAGIDCGAICSAEFDQGTEVTLTPSASAGSEFKEWTGACTGSGECKVTMSAAKSVGAKFDLAPKPKFTLTITKAGTGSGSVTCNGGACASSYDEGTTITLAASAAAGSSFAGWSGAGCSGTGTCEVTLNANTTVTATFNADPKPPVVNPPVTNPPVITPPPPPAPQCVVPKLAKKTLSQAKAALKAANCGLGKVTKPKKKKGPLVVKSSKPGAGTSHPAGSKVDLKLGPKPNSKKR
jgi:uncharacterized protein (DUF2141 family)